MASKQETAGRAPRPVRCSDHARCRAARRNVVPDAIDYVLAHGRQVRRTGVTFYFLGRQDMPRADRAQSWSARLEGTVVLQGRDGEVITVYRNRRAWHTILRKLKYRSTAGPPHRVLQRAHPIGDLAVAAVIAVPPASRSDSGSPACRHRGVRTRGGSCHIER